MDIKYFCCIESTKREGIYRIMSKQGLYKTTYSGSEDMFQWEVHRDS